MSLTQEPQDPRPANTLAPLTQANAPRVRRADARHPRAKKKKKRAALSMWQVIVISVLAALNIALLSTQLVYAAKLSDLEEKRAEEKAAYDRRVYRTTFKDQDLIRKYAAEYEVHPAYVAAVILNESSYDPEAVSSVGARGMMQLLPSSGEWIAPKIGVKNYTDDVLFDADTNVHMGAWYIGYLSDMFDGDPILVACAYHAGANNVKSWLKKFSPDGKTLTYDQIPYDNSRSYARKVVNSYAIYLQHYYTD